HMEAWSKVEAGFVTPICISHDTFDVAIPDVERNPVILKVWRNGADVDTCFYLENRQLVGFDSLLPGSGLLIWHIDPRQRAYHNRVDLEEDSTFHLDRGSGVRPDPHIYHQGLGDTSDCLPGNWNRTAFDDTTIPSSRDGRGQSTNVAIRNVRVSGDTVFCDITLGIAALSDASCLQPGTRSLAAYPNPFREHVWLSVSGVADLRPENLAIFDAQGRLVRRVALQGLQSGEATIRWNGCDERGRGLPSGVYLARLELGGRALSGASRNSAPSISLQLLPR
ncbi:MAG: FlgD immunoglobulin-like domain containing protein, partial [candidate division WOR-3 bacterium]